MQRVASLRLVDEDEDEEFAFADPAVAIMAFEGIAVELTFAEPRPTFGDLCTICGWEHPRFPPSGRLQLDQLADLGFDQVDDYFGIPNETDVGDDPVVWLYPLVRGEPVFYHEGPFDGIQLDYSSLALLSLTLPLACAGSTTTGDSRGSAGGAGDAATGDAETDAKPSDGTTTDADFNTIAECESDVELVYEYYTHSASYAPGEPVDWDPVGFREMLQALSERRPGKYRIKVSYSRGLDFESSTFVLMAGDTGSATMSGATTTPTTTAAAGPRTGPLRSASSSRRASSRPAWLMTSP